MCINETHKTANISTLCIEQFQHHKFHFNFSLHKHDIIKIKANSKY